MHYITNTAIHSTFNISTYLSENYLMTSHLHSFLSSLIIKNIYLYHLNEINMFVLVNLMYFMHTQKKSLSWTWRKKTYMSTLTSSTSYCLEYWLLLFIQKLVDINILTGHQGCTQGAGKGAAPPPPPLCHTFYQTKHLYGGLIPV